MREATAKAIWPHVGDVPQSEQWEDRRPVSHEVALPESWSSEQFAKDQIRHLVRQIFFAPGVQVRQVAFSPIDPKSDTASVCAFVGNELSGCTDSEVAVIGAEQSTVRLANEDQVVRYDGLKQAEEVAHPRTNLWFMPANAGLQWRLGASMRTYLEDVRREFEYSIVRAPSLSTSEEAWALAEWADGLVLVVSARQTRRASAIKIRQMLAEARVQVLGAVLSEREFPIPWKIYRRL